LVFWVSCWVFQDWGYVGMGHWMKGNRIGISGLR
jgi:hypothetical protein